MKQKNFEEIEKILVVWPKIIGKTGKKFWGNEYFSIIASIDRLMELMR